MDNLWIIWHSIRPAKCRTEIIYNGRRAFEILLEVPGRALYYYISDLSWNYVRMGSTPIDLTYSGLEHEHEHEQNHKKIGEHAIGISQRCLFHCDRISTISTHATSGG